MSHASHQSNLRLEQIDDTIRHLRKWAKFCISEGARFVSMDFKLKIYEQTFSPRWKVSRHPINLSNISVTWSIQMRSKANLKAAFTKIDG